MWCRELMLGLISHNETHSVGFPWTSDRPVAETPTYTANTTNKHPCPQRDFFTFSCTLYFFRTSFFVVIILHFAFCLLLTTRTSMPPAGILLFCFVRASFSFFSFCPCYLYILSKQFTYSSTRQNIHAPGGI